MEQQQVNQGRRKWLGGLAGILAAGVAPAVVGSSILMPVRKIATHEWEVTSWKWEGAELTKMESGVVVASFNLVIEATNQEDYEKMKALAGKKWSSHYGSRIVTAARSLLK